MFENVEVSSDAFGAEIQKAMQKHGYSNFMLAGIQEGTGKAMCMAQTPSAEKALIIVTLLMMQNSEAFELIYKAMMGSYMRSVAEEVMQEDEPIQAPYDESFVAKGKFKTD